MTQPTADHIRGTLVVLLNQTYRATRRDGMLYSKDGKRYANARVSSFVEFCQELGALSDDEFDEINAWRRKWSIHPGEFDWGVDWSSVVAERVECADCKGLGKWEDADGSDHLHTETCYSCGGRGYQNRARRGLGFR